MKIDSSVKSQASLKGSNAASATPRPVGTAAQGASATASAHVQIQHTEQKDGVHDADRVAEIRQAIAEGRFQINPERIADGLIESVRDMLAGRRQSA